MRDAIPEQTGFLYFIAIASAVSVSGGLSLYAFAEMFCGTWTPDRVLRLPAILCFATGFISGLIPVKKWWIVPLSAAVLPLNMAYLMSRGGIEKGMGSETLQAISYFATILGACLMGWAIAIMIRVTVSVFIKRKPDQSPDQ